MNPVHVRGKYHDRLIYTKILGLKRTEFQPMRNLCHAILHGIKWKLFMVYQILCQVHLKKAG